MYNEGIRTFTAGEALAARRRVKIKAGTTTTPPEVVYSDAGEAYIGVTEYGVASGEKIAVRLRNYPGTFTVEVAGAVALRAALYGAADGKLDDTEAGSVQAIALEAATADGDHIEVLPFPGYHGEDDIGGDEKWYGATAGSYMLWDQSADELILNAANATIKGTVTVGVDDTGHDVKFFGATSGKYFLWDESADKLIILGSADLGDSCEADAYTVGGAAGADFYGAVTNLTVVKGIVTAAS